MAELGTKTLDSNEIRKRRSASHHQSIPHYVQAPQSGVQTPQSFTDLCPDVRDTPIGEEATSNPYFIQSNVYPQRFKPEPHNTRSFPLQPQVREDYSDPDGPSSNVVVNLDGEFVDKGKPPHQEHTTDPKDTRMPGVVHKSVLECLVSPMGQIQSEEADSMAFNAAAPVFAAARNKPAPGIGIVEPPWKEAFLGLCYLSPWKEAFLGTIILLFYYSVSLEGGIPWNCYPAILFSVSLEGGIPWMKYNKSVSFSVSSLKLSWYQSRLPQKSSSSFSLLPPFCIDTKSQSICLYFSLPPDIRTHKGLTTQHQTSPISDSHPRSPTTTHPPTTLVDVPHTTLDLRGPQYRQGLHGTYTTGISPTICLFDSGSSHHMTPDLSLLSHCVSPVSPISIATANSSPMQVVSIGSILSTTSSSLSIPNVFYVPQLTLSLLSISQLSDSSFDVIFSSSSCIVQDRDSKKQIGTCRRVGDLYILEHLHIPPESTSTAASSFCLDNKSSLFHLWHSRLGHLSSDRFKLLVKSDSFISIKFEENGNPNLEKNKVSNVPLEDYCNISRSKETTKSVVEHIKPRGSSLRWQKRIGYLFRPSRWKRPTKGSGVCHVGRSKVVEGVKVRSGWIRSLTKRRRAME
ncbi:hypothetical protein Vadar_021070 [Vaccinium darrowii]|uniref:Uncharacterized protein n=1 Tax=Vaccinium darrowii TaxID=229202 RepID=A0ACB7Z590_9ERIC|nr:hypothetical protein Vadar_021070 [Vaccinium darrowii]